MDLSSPWLSGHLSFVLYSASFRASVMCPILSLFQGICHVSYTQPLSGHLSFVLYSASFRASVICPILSLFQGICHLSYTQPLSGHLSCVLYSASFRASVICPILSHFDSPFSLLSLSVFPFCIIPVITRCSSFVFSQHMFAVSASWSTVAFDFFPSISLVIFSSKTSWLSPPFHLIF